MAGRIGTTKIEASWDTGQYGALFTSVSVKARLVREQRLRASRSKPGAFDLCDFDLAGRRFAGVPEIDVNTGGYAAAAPIGIRDPDVLTIGYGLLSRYKTIWDYSRKRIYILRG